MPTIQRNRAAKSQAVSAWHFRAPRQRVVRGDWRKRVHHRPDPAGGGGNGNLGVAPRVLIVDDESSIRTICRFNLETDGMTVEEAADGRDALAAIGRRQPEIVLLDVMMPDLDGWEVAAQLAVDPSTRDIPVVFLSARASQEDKTRAQELGAVGYIVKPFDPVTLGTSVKDVLERIRRGEREQLNRELSDS